MGAELDVMLGIGLVSAILAYYGLSFLEHENFFTNLVGQIFFMISMIFLLLEVNTIFLIIQNDASISYLQDTVGAFLIEVFYYFMIVCIVIYIFYMFITIGNMAIDAMKGSYSRQKSNKKKGDVE